MSNPYTYSIFAFTWVKEANTFFADAWNLGDENHSVAFPSDKKAFVIRNPRTEGFRKFTFLEETKCSYIFESEDGIRCDICVNPECSDCFGVVDNIELL